MQSLHEIITVDRQPLYGNNQTSLTIF